MKHSAEHTRSSLPPAPAGTGARTLHWLRIAPRMPFVWFMRLYRLAISPLYGQVCRYYPSCSKYALDAFEVKGAVRGTVMTIWRLLRCNPFSPGGIDYVSGSVLEQQSELLNKGTAAGRERHRSRSGD
ncbi:membrane protein insertion efficiency factor YidD [Brevibacterium luteolum]|uniref:Putative membrane protein insertion efficiency factor n=1 Tax=Brevibacterium luteolum TaxID=199591 RepID=A0A6G8KYB7_9MICO|nr:membrane protein insertion efficiency factor YidD [Brevibacterium luteolum]QIN29646.1 membrane protein insertion efficiency factor YidD [Brevibacterium luteolum]